ncbi:MAG: hypothetical protein FJ146_03125 [Deltaproteobacteria bacterium]|nr:hypothetical protein [Deltaproteobacteria bacterium]
MSELVVPVSVGELIDKITILRIKERKIVDTSKLVNIRTELKALLDVCESHGISLNQRGVAELEQVNRQLWDIEDAIREKEASKIFDSEFIELARSVYQTNDQRAAIKSQINKASGSILREEKSYSDYR